jgi:hypothetical protein
LAVNDPKRCELENKEDTVLGCQIATEQLACSQGREAREAF